MKRFIPLLFISLVIISCKKELTLVPSPIWTSAHPLRPYPLVNTINDYQINWCPYEEVECYGDSYTVGPGAWPYPYQLGQLLGKTTINEGVSGQTSTQVKDRFFLKEHPNPVILMVGKNNGWKTDTIMHDIDTMISSLKHSKYFVITSWGTNTETDWKDDSTIIWHGMLNWVYTTRSKMLVEKYGQRCIDLLPILQANALPTYEDSMAVVHNVAPPSLCVDELHLNTKGYGILAAEIVRRLKECKN